MLKPLLTACALLCASVCFGANPIDLNLNQALSLAKAEEHNIFVYFKADWCLPCQLVKEGLLSDSRIKKTLKEDFVHVEVDIDNHLQKDWSDGYNASCLPHFLVLDNEGLILKEISGTLPIDLFYNILAKFSTRGLTDAEHKEEAFVLIDKVRVSEKIYPVTERIEAPRKKLMNNVPIKVTRPNKMKTITIGAFAQESNVHSYMQKIKETYGYELFIDKSSGGLHRLNIGPFRTVEDYRWLLQELKANDIAHYVRTIKN